ncbi:CPBP family intramembrane glutamic endopeptidase [Streptococcus marmotae]|uniref:CPBP family intramembrane glutamic endopeptidase n=1 Tax=Streptococcus marmotae TaxID=1825069 RepID=UPI00082FCAEB|nr:CPBP family intramembrane glutamic endopeptidase [Streptococcus marmotae]
MIRLLMIYGAIHLNVLLISLFLLGDLDGGLLLLFQVGFLVMMCWDWLRHGKGGQIISWKKRAGWVLLGIFFMVILSLLVSLLASEVPHNQARLMEVQSQVPLVSFLLFLWNASIAEEYCYRELLWKQMNYPLLQIIVTSFLFAFAHHPSSLATWLSYGSLGLVLGMVRLKTDNLTAIFLHIAWNGLVLTLSLL